MRGFLLVTCLLATALARPEAGYAYNGLQSGLPQNAHQLKPHVHQQLPAEHSFANFAAPHSTYLAPSPSSDVQSSNDHLQHLDAPTSSIEDIPGASQPLLLTSSQNDDSYNMAYQHSTNAHDYRGYDYAPQETTVHKHIYVHVPPKDFEDEDVITPRVRHQPAPKQKHYKIVFIKAPAAPSIRPPVVPPPPQNEEKTLIYVLHKRPEAEQDIVIPTAAPTKPSKPEVYFIKYKTKKEEAPVYGPPPSPQQQQQHQHLHQEPPQQQSQVFLDMEPRHIEAPSAEYGTPIGDNFAHAPAPTDAALTTIQTEEVPASQPQPQSHQFEDDVPSAPPAEAYGAPTMSAVIVPEEPAPTIAAPSNQYLAPEPPQTMEPIVVEDSHLPASKYGPPNRFFLKKKK